MKSFAIVLLCVVAAVQGRSTAVQASHQRSLAALGENPWVVHLRLAVSTSGLLETCAGSVIDASWLLTSASCVQDARFIWARYGVVEVSSPSLVLESSAVRLHPAWDLRGANDVALVAVNRVVESTENIAVIPLPSAGADVVSPARLCLFGEKEDNSPGDFLSCGDVEIIEVNDVSLIGDAAVSRFDTGAAVVSDGVQIGIVSQVGESDTVVIIRVDAYVDWLSSQTGVNFRGARAPESVIVVDN